MALIVPEVSAWSLFTINSWPSEDTNFTYIASGPSQPPYTFSSSPLSPLSSDISTETWHWLCWRNIGYKFDNLWHSHWNSKLYIAKENCFQKVTFGAIFSPFQKCFQISGFMQNILTPRNNLERFGMGWKQPIPKTAQSKMAHFIWMALSMGAKKAHFQNILNCYFNQFSFVCLLQCPYALIYF